jgi:hypothetical protein
MELDGSHLGSQGFSGTDLYESVLMHFKDAICLRKIFFLNGSFYSVRLFNTYIAIRTRAAGNCIGSKGRREAV